MKTSMKTLTKTLTLTTNYLIWNMNIWINWFVCLSNWMLNSIFNDSISRLILTSIKSRTKVMKSLIVTLKKSCTIIDDWTLLLMISDSKRTNCCWNSEIELTEIEISNFSNSTINWRALSLLASKRVKVIVEEKILFKMLQRLLRKNENVI